MYIDSWACLESSNSMKNLKKLCLDFYFRLFYMFLAVILVPELFRKLRETPGKNSHQVWSKSEIGCTSYDQKTKHKSFLDFDFPLFSPLGHVFHHVLPQIRILHVQILPGHTSKRLATSNMRKTVCVGMCIKTKNPM